MKIIINLTKEEVEHMKTCDTYYDACGYVQDIMDKVVKEINKSSKKREMRK